MQRHFQLIRQQRQAGCTVCGRRLRGTECLSQITKTQTNHFHAKDANYARCVQKQIYRRTECCLPNNMSLILSSGRTPPSPFSTALALPAAIALYRNRPDGVAVSKLGSRATITACF